METTRAPALEVERIRAEFPGLRRLIFCKPLVYLDSAASALKCRAATDAVRRFYSDNGANVHRGVHHLSGEATAEYEAAREKVRAFLGAACREEIVFVRGTTEGINLVAQSFLRPRLKPGDEVLITWMEHHSNIVPWQLVCEQTGATLRVAPIDDSGELVVDAWEEMLSERTKLAAVGHVSNALGTVNPVRELVAKAHARGVPVLVDGAQAAPHLPVDVRGIGCDFYAFSGHKVFGPTGIGALYAKRAHLEAMPPWQGGGDMIRSVSFSGTTYNEVPYKFEAGTPHIAGAIGLGAAVDWFRSLDAGAVVAWEHGLLEHATARLEEIPGVRRIGAARERAGVLSFVLEGVHPHDIGTILDHEGIAIRAGHHCAQPVMERFGVPATARASFAVYNTRAEVDALVDGLALVRKLFR